MDVASADELRRLARREGNRRTATRMLAIAHALDGLSRAEAARLAGLERQALRDAVVRYNAERLEGLADWPKPGRPSTLSEAEQAVLVATILRGYDIERDGGGGWTLPMLCRWRWRPLLCWLTPRLNAALPESRKGLPDA